MRKWSLILGGIGTGMTISVVAGGIYDAWSIVGGIGCVALLALGIFGRRGP